jgi:hypothetical protein
VSPPQKYPYVYALGNSILCGLVFLLYYGEEMALASFDGVGAGTHNFYWDNVFAESHRRLRAGAR